MPETVLRPSVIEQLSRAYQPPSPDEVYGAMDKAREAFALWKTVPVRYRARYLRTIRLMITDHQDEIVRHIARITEKTPTETLFNDVLPVLESLRYYEKNAATLLARRYLKTPFFMINTESYIDSQPLGVVAVIAPPVCPFRMSMIPLASALIAGNAVLLQPSDATPAAGELAALICRRASVPPDLVRVLYGGADTTGHIIAARPDKLFIAGDTITDTKILERAAGERVPAETFPGGKTAMVVFEDAPLERTVEGAVYGAFFSAGQSEGAVGRLYVQDTLYDTFLKQLSQRTKELRVGDGPDTDIGALAGRHVLALTEALVHDALKKGAKNTTPIRTSGHYYHPLILRDADHSMKITHADTFGPVLPVIRFHDEAEMLRLVNGHRHQAHVSIWTGNPKKGKKAAAQLTAGSCSINDTANALTNPALPVNGGSGRCHGAHGLYAFSHVQTVTINSSETAKEVHWFPFSSDLFNSVRTLITARFSDRRLPFRLKGITQALRFVNTRKRLW